MGKALERATRPGCTFTCRVSVGGSTVTDMTTTQQYNIQVAYELLTHQAHLPETVECHCGYTR
jgi:hypothetical protein